MLQSLFFRIMARLEYLLPQEQWAQDHGVLAEAEYPTLELGEVGKLEELDKIEYEVGQDLRQKDLPRIEFSTGTGQTGELGFEPRLSDPESLVLPLHYSPSW